MIISTCYPLIFQNSRDGTHLLLFWIKYFAASVDPAMELSLPSRLRPVMITVSGIIMTMDNNLFDPCAICLDVFEGQATEESAQFVLPSSTPRDPPVKLSCGHKYHYSCITTWAKGTPRCPLDRRIITGSTPPINHYLNLHNELIKSVENNQAEEVKEILSAGLTPEQPPDPDGLNALTLALWCKHWEIAAELLKAGWATEDKKAQTNLGRMYLKGLGVNQNFAEALNCYRKAAEQESPVAQNQLGWMYHNGLGVEQDLAVAIYWYQKSAEQGKAIAQNNLGCMYKNGFGVKCDYAVALTWFRKAAKQKNSHALCNLGLMYHHGLGVGQSYTVARSYYRKAARKGSAVAQANLGWLYFNGYGVECNFAKALSYFCKAANQGNTVALANVNWLQSHGPRHSLSNASFQG